MVMIHGNHHYQMKGGGMATINMRDFPEQLHREAKAKAALMGITLKELIIRAVTEYLKRN
jgi:predicted HicB family RNase H-like nuclease